ncbi:MAG: carbonic anhydrase [Pseudomonadota bacterium]|nr:carbonic anhydrase [Pseudomonadota bacterium]
MHKLLVGHATFRREFVAHSRVFMDQLASEHQSPDTLYIGCADSRVIPELLTTSAPGELFVVRNVANLVPPAERAHSSVGAALEYAVQALHVAHIVVCGHYGCGGVKAMIDGVSDSMPELRSWLAEAGVANSAARQHASDAGEQWRDAVEENVLDQLANLPTYPCVRERLAAGALTLHGWVYDLKGGLHVYDHDAGLFRESGPT